MTQNLNFNPFNPFNTNQCLNLSQINFSLDIIGIQSNFEFKWKDVKICFESSLILTLNKMTLLNSYLIFVWIECMSGHTNNQSIISKID